MNGNKIYLGTDPQDIINCRFFKPDKGLEVQFSHNKNESKRI